MKKGYAFLMVLLMTVLLAACAGSDKAEENKVRIQLSDEEILVDGEVISEHEDAAVYVANDIIFYLEGQELTYGEGTQTDAHSQEEADAHTVVHITEPGTYELSGTLSAGQIFVDLGEDTKNDPEAVVTLVLNQVDLTCTVAPAVLFYRVYECGEDDPEEASMDVDLTGAGANVVIADGTENYIRGSHVAKIYESCELSEDGTQVADSKTLYKFDGAFHSRRSMNVYGDTGTLYLEGDSEGLDSDLHMTIHGGNIEIRSGNDGINTSEDGVSVFTMNGGDLKITVTGETGEGDGIDSNGWLVINGGKVVTQACSSSPDSGLDSEQGIYLNGGSVISTGNMLDAIAEESQPYQVFSCRERVTAGTACIVKTPDGNILTEFIPDNDFQILVISTPELKEDESCTLWSEETQIAEGGAGDMPGGFGRRKERPEGMELPEGKERPESMKEKLSGNTT